MQPPNSHVCRIVAERARALHVTLVCVRTVARFLVLFVEKNIFTRRWSILVVWPAPGDRETVLKGGWLRPPPFRRVSRAPGAGQTSKIGNFRIRGGFVFLN